jgi:hypothetical protein
MTRWRWLALLALVLFAALVVVAPAGVPDTMIFGYGPQYPVDFLTGLGGDLGRLKASVAIDMIFPLVLTVVLILPLGAAARLPAIGYMLADYLENIALYRFYFLGADVPVNLSLVSQIKWALVALAIVVLVRALGRERRLP